MSTATKRSRPIPTIASSDDDDELPLITRRLPKKQRLSNIPSEDDNIPQRSPPSRLKQRAKRDHTVAEARRERRASASSSVVRPNLAVAKGRRVKKEEPKLEPMEIEEKKEKKERKEKKEKGATASDSDRSRDAGGYRWWDEGEGDRNTAIKWSTLVHNAVIFPPEYEPHGIPLLYNGQPVELSPDSEEIATFYAAKLQTDYVKKTTFRSNFFIDFRHSLRGTSASRLIKKLDFCDFSRIHAHLETKKQEKKDVPAAERKKQREEETERCKKYTTALVDGREEKVGNFRVEPPGLFLGRGEHPKMGKVKSRIYPEDITINIGQDAEVPPCPLEGHRWGKIIHKRDVTWLCFWKDSITGGSKYVWLAAGSAFKGMSDHAKFEKARRLSQYIEQIRRDYRKGWKAKGKEPKQRATAMYLIDKLALRVGNEKGEDEADTVGCCSLRVEHINFVPPNTIELDFLGKDSIRYFNSVQVEKAVYDNLKLFCRNKRPGDDIFHRLSVTGLNDYLKELMDGLSAKVFRTYNASVTLDQLLAKTPEGSDLNEKIVFYNQQNKEVAILCNHQRALPKAHGTQMEKMDRKVADTEHWLAELKRGRNKIKKAKGSLDSVDLIQWMPEKPTFTDDMDEKQRAAERKRAADAPRVKTERVKKLPQIETAIKSVAERLAKLKADMQVKDDLKTVALGTSKINYLDPRITVAWCKKHDVPIERIFAKTLLVKFAWSMETSEDFRF